MTDSLPMPVTALSPSKRTALVNLMRRAARAEVLPRFRSLSSADIATKSGPDDLVTEADIAAEQMIARGLARLFPGALIVGEEACAKTPELRDKIAEAETAFTIDPVDGTWNYASGMSLFGMMVAMTRFGQPIFGALYDPLMDDVIMAGIGEEAILQRPRRAPRRLTLSQGGPAETLTGYLPLYMVAEDQRAATAQAMLRFHRTNSLRCSCHEYRTFAQGHVDFVLSAGMTPWDHAAGVVIAQQAGGHVAMLDGSPYRADCKSGYLLVASDAVTWGRVRDVLSHLVPAPTADETADAPEA